MQTRKGICKTCTDFRMLFLPTAKVLDSIHAIPTTLPLNTNNKVLRPIPHRVAEDFYQATKKYSIHKYLHR
jgi:hypothetical protein